jgi:hypothetical protein
MIADSPINKMIDPSSVEDAGKVTLKAVSGIKNEYHFPGVPHWNPAAVIASTYEEALAIWKTIRTPATPEAVAEPKVEEKKEITNDK